MFPAAASLTLVKLYGALLAQPATMFIIRPVPGHIPGTPAAGPDSQATPAASWYLGPNLAVWYDGDDPVVQRLLRDVVQSER